MTLEVVSTTNTGQVLIDVKVHAGNVSRIVVNCIGVFSAKGEVVGDETF